MNRICGSCLCGQTKYQYTGILGPSSYCHCSDCKKVTGSAFVVSIRLDAKNFELVTNTKTKSYTKTADSGNSITRDFCSNCGSPIFTSSQNSPDYIWVRAGTLDDPSLIKPIYEYWTDSKVDWSRIPETIESFEKGRHESKVITQQTTRADGLTASEVLNSPALAKPCKVQSSS